MPGDKCKVDNNYNFCYNTYIVDKELDMNFTLITPTGQVYTFYIRETAECYQQAYGGTLVLANIVETVEII